MAQAVMFRKVSSTQSFYFTGFSIETIEKKEYIKINVLDRETNTTFSIYKENTGDAYDEIAELEDFENISEKVYVVYKNGRLKFAM